MEKTAHNTNRVWPRRWSGLPSVVLCLALLAACAPRAASPTPAGDPLKNAVLTWHREGSIAGFCDDLAIFGDGRLVATSCKGGRQAELSQGVLNGGPKEQLDGWLARFKAFEWERKDDAQADAMAVRVVFAGRGSAEATPEERQAIEAFAARQFVELTPQAEGPTPTPEVFHPLPDEGRAADATRDALVALLGVDLAAIHVRGVTAVEWPDSCLGLSQAGEVCA